MCAGRYPRCTLPASGHGAVVRLRSQALTFVAVEQKVAVFRQVNQDCPHVHHDALEFPDGELVLLTYLMEGQEATVLQLPADAVGSKAQQRVAYV